MKKKLLAIVCLIMAIMMSVACLGGCNLIVTDSEKDMQQVVATVSIEDGVESQMTKLDLVMDYVNYGYQYVQYGQKTMEETIEMIIDSRVETMILYQYSMKYLNEKNQIARPEITDKWNPSRYLTADEETEAKYEIYKAINDMLDDYIESEQPSKVTDGSSETPRTAPTDAKNFEKEVTIDEKREYINEGFDVKSSAQKREAFNKFINYLKINTLLGSDYVAGRIDTTAYFKNSLEDAKENKVLEKFQNFKKAEALLEYADENDDGIHSILDAEALFNEKVENQKEFDNAQFVEALGNAKADSPILYSAYGTYGYVYNLLLGVDTVQGNLISAIDKDQSDLKRAQDRAEILETTRIKDLRNTWITAGYDFDATTKTFTHDYALATQTLPFQGEVNLLQQATKEGEKDKYTATSTVYGLNEFISCMHNYMINGNFANVNNSANITDEKSAYNLNEALTASVKEAGKYNQTITEYDQRINELLFAFSTDSGSLNTYKGYLIKPKVDTGNEQYVETFADAGRILLEKGSAGNGQSFVIVASDYGYHVMFYSEIYKASMGELYNDLADFLTKEGYDLGEYGSWAEYYDAMMNDFFNWEDTDNFLYVLQNNNVSARVSSLYSKDTAKVVAKYRYELTDRVTINEKAYKDLID